MGFDSVKLLESNLYLSSKLSNIGHMSYGFKAYTWEWGLYVLNRCFPSTSKTVNGPSISSQIMPASKYVASEKFIKTASKHQRGCNFNILVYLVIN